VLDSDPRKMSQAGMRAQAEISTEREKIDSLVALTRAGFDPDAALAALGLPAIPHTGAPPVTASEPVGVASPGNGTNGNARTNGNGG
jgi:hypothetical protein